MFNKLIMRYGALSMMAGCLCALSCSHIQQSGEPAHNRDAPAASAGTSDNESHDSRADARSSSLSVAPLKQYTPELISAVRWGIGQYACADTFTADGKILVGVNGWYYLFSKDRGVTWERIDIPKGKDSGRFIQLRNGTLFGLSLHNEVLRKFSPEQAKIPYVAKVNRAKSIEDAAAGQVEASFAVVDIPDLAIGYGDSGSKDDYFAGVMDHGIVEMPNGDIVATMYGQFKQDKSRVPYFKNYAFYQYRAWCIISRDGGKSFKYLSTIADVQTHPIDHAAEGYCEADLLHLGGNHLIAVMRTQGHEVYSPLYVNHSHDGGVTWGKPEKMNDFGVFPRLVRLTNGALVCASGKYHNFLLFSDDNGYTWSKPFVVAENRHPWDKGPSGYPTLIEVAPNEILLVYDDTEDRASDFAKNPHDRRIVYIHRYRIHND